MEYIDKEIGSLKLSNQAGVVCYLECYWKSGKNGDAKRIGKTDSILLGQSGTLNIYETELSDEGEIWVTAFANVSAGKDSNGKPLQWTKEQYKASLKGDPFPGLQNKTQLLNVTLNKSTLEKPIYNIKETGGVITFDYLKDLTTGIDSPITNVEADKDASIYTLDGRYLGTDASKLGKGVYVIGKKKVVIK